MKRLALTPEVWALAWLVLAAAVWGMVALCGCTTTGKAVLPPDAPDAPHKIDAEGHPNYGPPAWPRSTN